MKAIAAAIPRTSYARAATFVGLLAIGVVAPYLNNQLVTGPIVNATLIIATVALGAREAILIGLFPSLISITTGLLPIVLAPAIPFIMVGNTLLIVVFDLLRRKSYWTGAIGGAVAKFIFLFGFSSIVAGLFTNPLFAKKATLMLGSVQLVTALIGVVIAYIFLSFAKGRK